MADTKTKSKATKAELTGDPVADTVALIEQRRAGQDRDGKKEAAEST